MVVCFALCVAVTGAYGAPAQSAPRERDQRFADMRPYIPSPGRAGQKTAPRVRLFPAAEFQSYLKYYDEQLITVSRSEEPQQAALIRERLSARLASVLSSGRVRFDRSCPLKYTPAEQEPGALYVVLSVRCLPAGHRHAFQIRLYAGNPLSGTRFPAYAALRQLKQERDFIGNLRLVYRAIQEGFVPDWRWQGEEQLGYANGLLEALRARYPTESEDGLLAPGSLRASTATLLRRFATLSRNTRYRRDRDLSADFLEIFPEGSWLTFGPSCPLGVQETLRREPGTEFYRLELVIDCLSEYPELARVQVLLAPDSEALQGPIKLLSGERLQAQLKFREISGGNAATGLQFRLVWDTIKEIRADVDRARIGES